MTPLPDIPADGCRGCAHDRWAGCALTLSKPHEVDPYRWVRATHYRGGERDTVCPERTVTKGPR